MRCELCVMGWGKTPPDPAADVLDLHGAPPSSKECQRFLNLCNKNDQHVRILIRGGCALALAPASPVRDRHLRRAPPDSVARDSDALPR